MNIQTNDVMRFTHFSSHAAKRVYQRTKLTPREVGVCLDMRLSVNTGCEPGLNREHLLFYSQLDDCCFIAIRDTQTGEVITVLPLEYNQNLAWTIQQVQIAKAKQLVYRKMVKPVVIPIPARPSVIVVSCSYLDDRGSMLFKPLLKVQAASYEYDVVAFMYAADTPDLIDKFATMKEISHENILTISVRLGNKGLQTTWDLRKHPWMH